MDGPLIVGKDLQLYPHQHEPVVRQLQQDLHQSRAHPLVLVIGVHVEPHGAHVAHPGVGADREPGAADHGAVLQHRHKVVVVGPQPGDERLTVGGAAGGKPCGVLKHAGHPPQGGGTLRVPGLDGADGIVHEVRLPMGILAIIAQRRAKNNRPGDFPSGRNGILCQ